MTRHDDRSQAGRDLANGLLADLGGAPLPEEGVRETHGHNAASFAVEAHRPPAAHHMGTQPNPVVVSQTDPVWPPKTAATLVSAGNELVSSTELDRSMPPSSRDAVTVQRAPVSVRGGGAQTLTELPSPSPPLVVRPMVGRTTAPSVRVKSSVSKAIVGGFAVGGVLVAAMGLWFVLSKDPAPVAAPAGAVVVSVMRPSSAVVTAEAPAPPPAVVTPAVVTASAVAAPVVVTKPRAPSAPVSPAAPAAPAKPTSKPNPTSGPIEEPDRTF